MINHKATVEHPTHGKSLVYFEHESRRLPNSGPYSGYCPAQRSVIHFDFSQITESREMSAELV
jgi:hypothetical protein